MRHPVNISNSQDKAITALHILEINQAAALQFWSVEKDHLCQCCLHISKFVNACCLFRDHYMNAWCVQFSPRYIGWVPLFLDKKAKPKTDFDKWLFACFYLPDESLHHCTEPPTLLYYFQNQVKYTKWMKNKRIHTLREPDE